MKDQDYRIFEAYITGDLESEEMEQHNKKLQEDNDYRESFELYKTLNEHLKSEFENTEDLEQFEKSVSSISSNYFERRKHPKFAWVKMTIAASIIIAIGLYFLFGEVSKPQYQEVAQIPTIHLSERGANVEVYLQAEKAFNQRQYAQAIELFDQILREDNQMHSIRLYQAIAYMETGQAENAKKLYDKIIQQKNAFSEEALWYAALNELNKEDYPACKSYLKKIKPSASRYEDATNLLNEL
ncbi:Tetratricopeptide repeat-containing protein [Marivirga sericea]|uniref:Tetratricopeptide repeat-containing protein n=1 Tax=Marivirga sericea TaxID=1028 RepID=A0A1X7JY30_9BACT|nr:tetratricopeptide repeat protein [Marivirga sericea]SMG33041.1 Tetratricopeptide repeat-containing protein [Marivirga sericea]